MRLEGTHALVTGAGSGLGQAIALAMAREGANVAINDLDPAAAEATAEAVRAAGRTASVHVADVSDSAAVRAMVAAAAAEMGTLDILVNNAGYAQMPDGVQERSEQAIQEMLAGGGGEVQILATQSLTDAEWSRMLAVHLNGTFFCTREALKIMEARRAGKIINMASIAGTTGLPTVPHYSAAKAGIIGFTKAVAREVVRSNIQVNAIAPGFIDTPLLSPLSQVMRFATVAQIPMGRLGVPEEVAETAVYLASADANFLVGQVLSPNGGQVI